MRLFSRAVGYRQELEGLRTQLNELINDTIPNLKAALTTERVREEIVAGYQRELKTLQQRREQVIKEKRERMRETALGLLRGEVGLGLAVRLVGHLGEGGIEPGEFLNARFEWLSSLRGGLFEWLDGLLVVITQYRALFGDPLVLSWHLVRAYVELEEQVKGLISPMGDLKTLKELWNRLVVANGPFSRLQADFMFILSPLLLSHARQLIMAPSQKAFGQIISRLRSRKTATTSGEDPALLILSKAWKETQKLLLDFEHPDLQAHSSSWLQEQRDIIAKTIPDDEIFLNGFDRLLFTPQ